jgi:5-methylcytosine-specific restriction endonuclease McrA
MTARSRTTKAWLLVNAKEVAGRLKPRAEGTRLRIRTPGRATRMNTDGWAAVVGSLGKGMPRLVVWLDKFSGHPDRKLYAGFCSPDKEQIDDIAQAVSEKLWPIRFITEEEIAGTASIVLADKLKQSEFNAPIYEDYSDALKFYGIYDPTRGATESVNSHFCYRAVDFFEDVARALPHAQAKDAQREVYPQCENRNWVTSHLNRERSGYLATECKIRDKYRCHVCKKRFEDVYGELGRDFAEAHHIVPLSQLPDAVTTKLEDLVTVCANCHRMLHRMEGTANDVAKLRGIFRRAQK